MLGVSQNSQKKNVTCYVLLLDDSKQQVYKINYKINMYEKIITFHGIKCRRIFIKQKPSNESLPCVIDTQWANTYSHESLFTMLNSWPLHMNRCMNFDKTAQNSFIVDMEPAE